MPRPRLTIRRLMIAVAVVAAGLGSANLWWLSRWYAILARNGADSERRAVATLKAYREVPGAFGPMSPAELRAEIDRYERYVAYFRASKLKYIRAARYPFLPIADDSEDLPAFPEPPPE